ncbi:hypothetical protein HPB49_014488 [Dermacentor silvarum]|uniref:Uncharacterized protein n=1 Tax=Dermacentor silvarum TaxID=543639 RepID=A0ACB8C450_DERSI|nr:hypothetical protein HPB49_014488 [Dermacentor silvarum]
METVSAVPESPVKLDTTNGKCSSDEKCGGANGGSDDREGSDPKKEELPSPPATKLKGGKRKRRSNGDAAGGSQPTLIALFSQMAKRLKNENKKPAVAEASYTRCSDCRQVLDAAELRRFEGDPAGAVDEFSALTDPRLSVFDNEAAVEDGGVDVMDTPQHKLTQFAVYDRHTHLCPIDAGLIERDVELYFSGYVKPI